MRRPLSLTLSLMFAATSLARPLAAQRAPKLEVGVAPAAALTEGPAIASDGLLGDPKIREHLLHGFPASIHYRLELWHKGGVFDDPAGRTEWDVLVKYEQATQLYNVLRSSNNDQVRENLGGFKTVTSADLALGGAFKAPLHPNRSGRYYYHLVVVTTTLTYSDLDALQQWLRGPDSPGKTNNPLAVIRSGLGTLVSRVLGGSKITQEATSGNFTIE